MAQTFSKLNLSGSTSGRGIKVVQTATAGTLIHTAHATALDEICLWAWNSHTADVLLTLENGGVTVPDDLMSYTIPFQDGWHLIDPGLILTGALALRAFAASANKIIIRGFVNRIT